MSPKFSPGEIVIIQNLVGNASIYNGLEVQILRIEDFRFKNQTVYQINLRHYTGGFSHACESELRRREQPYTGEQSIRALFTAPPVNRRRPVTAWQAQYDTAQGLMTMGVRVRPCKWLVGEV